MVLSRRLRLQQFLIDEHAYFRALCHYILQRDKARTRMRVHAINKARKTEGQYALLRPHLEADENKFIEYFRVDWEKFDHILAAVQADLEVHPG